MKVFSLKFLILTRTYEKNAPSRQLKYVKIVHFLCVFWTYLKYMSFGCCIFNEKNLSIFYNFQMYQNNAFLEIVKILVVFLQCWRCLDVFLMKMMKIPEENHHFLIFWSNKKNVQNGVRSDLTKKCQICERLWKKTVTFLDGLKTDNFGRFHDIIFCLNLLKFHVFYNEFQRYC